MNYIKNHKVALLIAGIIIFSIVKFAAEFYSGYLAVPFWVMALFSTEPIRYILIAICVIVVITIKELNKKRKALIYIALALLLVIGLIPDGHFVTLGALLSIRNSRPMQIRDDARLLLDEYQAETLFSNDKNQRYPFNNPIPKNKLPLSLQNANINDVLVLNDYVFLEKFGATALFRGFIVFREGSDIWENEKAITLLDGCNYCWKIRVIDGLYWYHDVPSEEEIATFAFPLK
jgi:hypothetical protein